MRWPEVFVTVLKSQGHTISLETVCNLIGVDYEVLVDGRPLEIFLQCEPVERAGLLRQFVVHVSRIFNNMVQTFIQKVVMSKYDGCLRVLFYTYRVEMQLRGMAHIDACLWLDDMSLRNTDKFSETELIILFIYHFITCELPSDTDPLRQSVQEVQTHHHTKLFMKKTPLAVLVFRSFLQN